MTHSLTIHDLRESGHILLECISGSKAYGLDTPQSDLDIRGVFYLPKDRFYGLEYVPQISEDKQNVVFYELGRFIELLYKNNPNILELLATPAESVRYKHPFLTDFTPELFLSKKCKDTFGGYAYTQINKARGLNKKIVNPIDEQRKTILDFCHVLKGHGSMKLSTWLDTHNYSQDYCGLASVPNFKDVYALYYDPSATLKYAGIRKSEKSTQVVLSSIPKDTHMEAHLHYNEDGFVKSCKDYKQYWEWVEKRNESRYQSSIQHGKYYDAKNMMHTFRLLNMAEEILRESVIHVKRNDRDELLKIRNGLYEYDDLIELAEKKMRDVESAFHISALPDEPDFESANALLIRLRTQLYGG